MISEIAYTQIFGKPFVVYLGIITLLSFLFTASIAFMNVKGIHRIPFKWHPRMAAVSLILALIHGLFAASIYLNI